MPKPPLLPLLNWREIFASSLPFEKWIREGESPENRRQMQEMVKSQFLAPQEEAQLKTLARQVHVVAIAEDWCGDVVRHVPVLEKLAQTTDKILVGYLSRRKSLEAFVRFLTNGGEAIPKFIFLNHLFVECGHWGPMPESCRQIIARGKACGDLVAARQKVSSLYKADPEKREVVRELLGLITIASATAP
jgi:hypothetical protein